MKRTPFYHVTAFLALLIGSGMASSAADEAGKIPAAADLRKMTARFAPVDLKADVSRLPVSERQALGRIIAAAREMDGLYLRQVWAGNPTLLLNLSADDTPVGRARLHAFLVNKGPWTRLDQDLPFLPGVPQKPAAANFYPPDATKAEVEAWMKSLPDVEHERAGGFFTVIRRGQDGKLMALPYSLEYQGELMRAAALLDEAAALTQDRKLKDFLHKRARAFIANDYYASDVAWMALDSAIDPTIGPYEVYEDGWFNAKAAFEAFIGVRDDAETARLQKLSAHLQDIEDHLPIDAKLRTPKLGALAPIRVVNSVFCAGDGNRAVQTAAYNLPNDERIVREKGTKRVMLKNVQEAKFRMTLVPIARVALSAADQKQVAFDAFFTHILMHEMVHGLGPHEVRAQAGRAPATVRELLQDSYSAIEEAKADIGGLFAMQYLVDKGVLPRELAGTMYTTFLASAFRSIRFGTGEAHGKGVAMQLNYLLDAGAVRVDNGGTFRVDPDKARAAVRGLTAELMTLQGEGDRDRAQDLLRRLGVVRPEVQHVLDRLRDVPVDIEPRFPTADRLQAEDGSAGLHS